MMNENVATTTMHSDFGFPDPFLQFLLAICPVTGDSKFPMFIQFAMQLFTNAVLQMEFSNFVFPIVHEEMHGKGAWNFRGKELLREILFLH